MEDYKREILSHKTKEELLALDRTNFTKSECQEIIDETRLTTLDRSIAVMRVIECKTFEEIGSQLALDKRTVSAHWSDISRRLKESILRMFYKGDDLF